MESLTRFKSRRLALLLAAFSLVLFTACGGDDDGSTGGSNSDLADEQVLRLNMNDEPGTIDPHLVSVSNEVSITRQLASGLFTYNEDLEVVAAIAEEVPTVDNGGVSEDGLTYTISLKESTWSDGSAVTAEDFVYSTLRVLDPNFGSPSAWVFYDIAGAAAYNKSLDTEEGKPAPPASEVETLRSQVGIAAQDDRTLVYTLEAPNPAFLNVLAHVVSAPVKQSVVEQYGDAWTDAANYIGNGPFVLNSWEPGSRMVLGRNDAWYGQKPTLERIEVSFLADDAAAYRAYINNEIHAVLATESSLSGGDNASELVTTPRLETYALFMNNASTPFDNELVRQAFGSAIDREAYVTILQGAGAPTTTWLPPGMPAYTDTLGRNMNYDPEGIEDLLSEAEFDGGEVELILIASDRNERIGQFLEAQLESNIDDIDVTVEFFDQGQYFDELFSGNYDLTIQSWIADWPAPDNFLSLFHSQNGNNFIAYSNPNYDELLDDAALAGNYETRLELYSEAEEILLGEAGLAPMYNDLDNTFVKPNIRNLIITGIDGALRGDLFFWKTQILKSGS